MIENPSNVQLKTLKMIIYLIENQINGKKYIGMATNGFYKRYNHGTKWWYETENDYLKYSVKKYGLDNFKVKILAYNVDSIEMLEEIEIFCINILYNSLYPNGYNFNTGGRKTNIHEKQ